MKTVKEMAKVWNCGESTVRRYCSDGVIPPAEKSGPKKWMIPGEWPKPPMSRHGLCFLLDTVFQLKNGVEYNSIAFGYSSEDIRKGYEYLMKAAFVSTIDVDNLQNTLPEATVTPRGVSLIRSENQLGKSKTKFTAYGRVKSPIGPIGGEVGIKFEKEVERID